MRYGYCCVLLQLAVVTLVPPESRAQNTRQYYSGKLGYYRPRDGLNNGLLIGVDGVTEFLRANVILAGSVDAYPKQSIDIFKDPQPGGRPAPDISQQQIVVLPIHLNLGYKLFEAGDIDSRMYAGVGGGYYFYFYSATYRTPGGLPGGSLTSSTDSKNGGDVLGTAFIRLLVNQIFIEPRLYFASRSADQLGGYSFVVNPSGFAVTLGFQSR